MPATYLKIAGDLLDRTVLEAVDVEERLNAHSVCELECRQTSDARFPIEERIGSDIQVVVGSGTSERVVFDGFLTEVELEYKVFGSYSTRMKAVSRSYHLDAARQECYWRKGSLGDVAAAVTGKAGLTLDLKCPPSTPKNYVQWGETDFSLLRRLADDQLCWIRPNASGIEICREFQPGSELSWRDEYGLTNFRVRGTLGNPSYSGTHFDARTMASRTFHDVSRDPEMFDSMKRLAGAVKTQSRRRFASGRSSFDPRAATASEYAALLERESIRTYVSGIEGRGTSRQETLRPGNVVRIEGVLDARGEYGLTRVAHHWRPTGYWNEFWCTPSKTYLDPEPPPVARIPGLVSARVLGHNDPRRMGRVQVQYDWQEEGQTAWIRMATPHAGHDRGFMFMPEVGDEVLVGFEHGDPERPFIVGCLWNGVDHAPRQDFWGDDLANNDVKRIVTKSGHRIQLSDKEGKEAIVIATPSRLKIALLEKSEETGRSMVMMHSQDGDLMFSAPNGRIHFHSKYFSRKVGAGRPPSKPRTIASEAPAPVAAPRPSPAPRRSSEEPTHDLRSFAHFEEALGSGAAGQSTARVLQALSGTVAPFDHVSLESSGELTAGALRHSMADDGGGELPRELDRFRKEHADTMQRILEPKGWTVERETPPPGRRIADPKLYFRPRDGRQERMTGDRLTRYLQEQEPERRKELLQPLVELGRDPDYQKQQVASIADRLAASTSQRPTGFPRPIREYLTSEAGAAAVGAQAVTHPSDVRGSVGHALRGFFAANPSVSRDPRHWSTTERSQHEAKILAAYQNESGQPALPASPISAAPGSMRWPAERKPWSFHEGAEDARIH